MSILAGIALTVVGAALLNNVIKESFWPEKAARRSRSKVIEIDEYEIVDEADSQDRRGYKVEIRD